MIRHLRPPTAAFALAILVLTLGACGSSDEPARSAGTTTTSTSTAAAAQETGRFTIKQVEELTGLKPAADGTTWTSVTGCRVTAILLTHAAILGERTTPDALVVTNSADDVGVKFDPVAGCREALLANLSAVK